MPNSMVVAWQAPGLSDALEAFGAFQNRATIHLPHQTTLNLLPRRLRRGVGIAARRRQRSAPPGQFILVEQDIGRAEPKVDAHAIAAL